MKLQRVASILALLMLLVIGMSLDWFNSFFDRLIRPRMIGGFLQSLWVDVIANLLFASALLLVAWLFLVKNRGDRGTAWIFTFAGGIVFLSGTPFGIYLRNQVLFMLGQRLPIPIIHPDTLFFFSGSVTLLLGIYGLLKKNS